MLIRNVLRKAWQDSLQPRYEAWASIRRSERRRAQFLRRDKALDQQALMFLRSLNPQMAPELSLVGGKTDGGYLIPLESPPQAKLFSPGVGHVVDFEFALASAGHKVFMIDGTVEGPPRQHENFLFEKRNLGFEHGAISLGSWIHERADVEEEIILQMDVEGEEWRAFLPRSIDDETLKRIAWMIVEFHGFENFWNDKKRPDMLATLERILENHFPAAVHPNNCGGALAVGAVNLPSVFEVTFVNRQYSSKAHRANLQMPDFSNCPNRPRVAWPFPVIA